jgi:hypothetical protein
LIKGANSAAKNSTQENRTAAKKIRIHGALAFNVDQSSRLEVPFIARRAHQGLGHMDPPRQTVRFHPAGVNVPGTGFNAHVRSSRRFSIRRLDKLSDIAKHGRELQLTMENPRAERPIRDADAGSACFRPRHRDGG